MIHRSFFRPHTILTALLFLGVASLAAAAQDRSSPAVSDSVTFFLLPTAEGQTREMYTISGGAFSTPFTLIYGAVLVRHGHDAFLFDTGLGEQVDNQFEQDMPWWARPFFEYEKQQSVRKQLEADSTLPRPTRIFLSHGHWDHAGGLVDFPDLPVWVPQQEYDFIHSEGPPAVFPSQFTLPDSQWHIYDFEAKNYAGFEHSLDLYGDGSVVLVLMGGHTPGSVGLFINRSHGRNYLFPGDLVWNHDQIDRQKGKFWLSRLLADYDSERVDEVIRKLHDLLIKQPALQIIPAHDARSWDRIIREH